MQACTAMQESISGICVQMSDRKLGMLNIRGDEDVPPEQTLNPKS